MIKVKINYNDNKISGFKVTGHANFDRYGKDIVCASVSSIVITSVNLALELDGESISYNSKEGLIEVTINKDTDVINKIFENMINMLKELEEQYSKNIKFI